MATDLSTTNVTDTKVGTGWTIDVTACNLLSDLSIKDFIMLIGGSLEPNSNITKTSQTVLTYTGTSISSSTVEVRRVTPQNRFQEITFAEKFSSTIFNEEIDRIIRKAYEYTLNGIGPGSTATIQTPLDDAYGVGWDADTIRPATRNALYDKFELMGDLADDEDITGNWTAPTQTDASNNTRLATTAYADTRVTNALANSPALGGNPTTTTQSSGNNSTRIATTAFVQTEFTDSPALGGDPTSVTPGDNDVDTSVATTAFVNNRAQKDFLNALKTASLALTSGITSDITNYASETDADGNFNTTTGVYTSPDAGWYLINLIATITVASGLGRCVLGISVAGADINVHRTTSVSTETSVILNGSLVVLLAATDVVKGRIFVNGTSPALTNARFSIVRLFTT